MSWSIRPGIAADIEAVMPLVARQISFHEELDPPRFGASPEAVERYRGWLARVVEDESAVYLVAEEGGAVFGFLLAVLQDEYRIYRAKRVGFIHELWVDEAQRRQGVGAALVMEAKARFAAMGAAQVRLDTSTYNERAQRLFEACGFRRSTIEMLAALYRPRRRRPRCWGSPPIRPKAEA
jgi:ribosomal protein S18 acetylase RimI-like enzyme